MIASFTSLAVLSLLGLAAAVPTPVELAPRCGTTLYPSSVQKLDESTPSTVYPSSNQFRVAGGGSSSRQYEAVVFNNIPAGSYGCQLNVKFPPGYYINNYNTPTLNVTTLFKDKPLPPTNTLSWSTLYPPNAPSLGQGLFGTVTLTPGQTTAINSESCAGNLAYVFAIASWVEKSSSVEYTQQDPNAGVYLTYNC